MIVATTIEESNTIRTPVIIRSGRSKTPPRNSALTIPSRVRQRLTGNDGAEGIRTPDLLNAIEALYQLS